MAFVSSLRYAAFAFLWSGQTVSRLGDHLFRVAMAWWVLQKTGSGAAMGAVLIFASVPMLIFLLIGGVTVDRFSRARVMFISDVGRGITVALITALAFTDKLELWHVYASSVLFGSVAAFFQPAYVAIIPDIVPSEGRPSANSLTALSAQLTGILGPAVGALVIAQFNTAFAFGLDAASFFISALCLIPLLPHHTALTRTDPARETPLSALRAGVRAVLAAPWLWMTILLAGLMNLTAAGPYSVALPFMVKTNLNNDVQALGWLYSAGSLGSVAAAFWLGRKTHLRHRGASAYLGLVVWGIGIAVLGLPVGLALVLIASFVLGVALNIFNLIWTNTLQEMVPPDLLGRVSSIDFLGSFVLLPIGYGLAGWASDWIGATQVLLIGGVLTAQLALVGLAQRSIRQLD
jgi:MFS family permease